MQPQPRPALGYAKCEQMYGKGLQYSVLANLYCIVYYMNRFTSFYGYAGIK